MFCPKCGNEIEEGELIKFKSLYLCPKCGCDTGYKKPVDADEKNELKNEEDKRAYKIALISTLIILVAIFGITYLISFIVGLV